MRCYIKDFSWSYMIYLSQSAELHPRQPRGGKKEENARQKSLSPFLPNTDLFYVISLDKLYQPARTICAFRPGARSCTGFVINASRIAFPIVSLVVALKSVKR
jgi:hypothetical protein